MALVWIPPLLRSLTAGHKQVSVPGATVGQVIDALDVQFPGMKARLVSGDRLMPGIAIAVDGTTGTLGLLETVQDTSEIQILPAIGGGRARL